MAAIRAFRNVTPPAASLLIAHPCGQRLDSAKAITAVVDDTKAAFEAGDVADLRKQRQMRR